MATKRVLILGVSGSLGGYLAESLQDTYNIVCPTPRQPLNCTCLPRVAWLQGMLDVYDSASLLQLLVESQADVAINCVAITPGSSQSHDRQACLEINGAFPHRLADAASVTGTYLINIGTDGVYTGRKGNYREVDPPDADDFYGESKRRGELDRPNCVTLRTSFFGAFSTGRGFVNWLLRQSNWRQPPTVVDGFENYVFTGLSAAWMARAIGGLIDLADRPAGILHLGGRPVSKFTLLSELSERADLNIRVRPVSEPRVDRSLDSTRFWRHLGWEPPDLETMVEELAIQLRAAPTIQVNAALA